MNAPKPNRIAGFVLVRALHEAKLEEAYRAGHLAMALQRKGQPWRALWDRWVNGAVPNEVQRAFYQGIDDE